MNLTDYQFILDLIASRQNKSIALLEKWAGINSGTDNLAGLSQMADALIEEFSSLKGTIHQRIKLKPRRRINSKGEWVETPLGDALSWQKKTNADVRIFLGGHMDTVFSPASPFQKTERINENILQGPGVADMKGGLIVLLTALQALQESPFADHIDWEVLINPDEEIGSPGSSHLFEEVAKRNTLGLIFEPSYPDGSFVSSRKGSSNWTAIAKGRSAHVGRDFQNGRNALTALARFLLAAENLTNHEKGITVNVGSIEGGGPVNIVPDLAVGKFNIRVIEAQDLEILTKELYKLTEEASKEEGIAISLHANENNPPKPFDAKQKALFNAVNSCAVTLGMQMHWKPSGGACDGSRLYAAGLPNIDTLGVIGGQIHTSHEYVELDSLTKRAQLTALFLMQLASGRMLK